MWMTAVKPSNEAIKIILNKYAMNTRMPHKISKEEQIL